MMNQEDLFRKLGAILNELNDQYEYLAQNPQKFNELELELFLANANFLADHIQIIRKLTNSPIMKELPEHAQQVEESPVLEEPQPFVPEYREKISEIDQEPVSFEFILHEKQQADAIELPLAEELNAPIAEEPDVPIQPEREEPADLSEEIGPEPFLVEKEEEKVPLPNTTLVLDNVPEKVVKPTLNDLLASSLKKDEPAASVGTPITDLKQAINLNDKLLYIKDLFNGYNLAYSEAIEIINKMPDFKTVDAFLKNNYAIKNNWSAKQGTVDRFYELIQRRF